MTKTAIGNDLYQMEPLGILQMSPVARKAIKKLELKTVTFSDRTMGFKPFCVYKRRGNGKSAVILCRDLSVFLANVSFQSAQQSTSATLGATFCLTGLVVIFDCILINSISAAGVVG